MKTNRIISSVLGLALGEAFRAPYEGGLLVPEVHGNADMGVVTKDGCDRFLSSRQDIRWLPHEGYL